MIKRICQNCGKEFWAWDYRVGEGYAKYCSIKCANFGRWKNPTLKMMEHTKKAQKIAWKKRLGSKHTEKTKIKMSNNRKGKALKERNSRWRGGISNLRISIHGLPEYKLWRKHIFEKDDYTCQICKKRGDYLEVDHFPVPFRDLINGIKDAQEARKSKKLWKAKGRTLCRKCHNKTKIFVSNQYVK